MDDVQALLCPQKWPLKFIPFKGEYANGPGTPLSCSYAFINLSCKSFDFPKKKNSKLTAKVRQGLFFHIFWDLSFIRVLLNRSRLLLAKRLLELQKQPFCCLFFEVVMRLATSKRPSRSCGADRYASNRNKFLLILMNSRGLRALCHPSL